MRVKADEKPVRSRDEPRPFGDLQRSEGDRDSLVGRSASGVQQTSPATAGRLPDTVPRAWRRLYRSRPSRGASALEVLANGVARLGPACSRRSIVTVDGTTEAVVENQEGLERHRPAVMAVPEFAQRHGRLQRAVAPASLRFDAEPSLRPQTTSPSVGFHITE